MPTEQVVEQSITFLEHIFPSPRNFTIRLWNQEEIPAELDSTFALVLNHPGTLRRMFTPPIELALGEAYIYQDFDIEGDYYAAFGLIDALSSRTFAPTEVAALIKEVQGLPKSGPDHSTTRKPLELNGDLHSRERDRDAVRFHYDVGNEFYALWLDRQMQYSCGYFPTETEDLDTAQASKIEHICRKLRLKPGERLLDIGCGWGGLALAAAQRYGVSVLGITLSERQAEYGAEQSARLRLKRSGADRDAGLSRFGKGVVRQDRQRGHVRARWPKSPASILLSSVSAAQTRRPVSQSWDLAPGRAGRSVSASRV
jgi:cyclopropane-fatty-acyl-phospholipid synthase